MEWLSTTREWLGRRPYVTSGVLMTIAVGALYLGWQRSTTSALPPRPSEKIFLIDENTGEVSIGDTRQVPPLKNASGQETVVQAVFYTFDGGKTRTLAYLQKYTPEARTVLLKLLDHPALARDVQGHDVLAEGMLIRSPEKGSPWVSITSPEAAQISQRALRGARSGDLPQIVQPD